MYIKKKTVFYNNNIHTLLRYDDEGSHARAFETGARATCPTPILKYISERCVHGFFFFASQHPRGEGNAIFRFIIVVMYYIFLYVPIIIIIVNNASVRHTTRDDREKTDDVIGFFSTRGHFYICVSVTVFFFFNVKKKLPGLPSSSHVLVLFNPFSGRRRRDAILSRGFFYAVRFFLFFFYTRN